MSNYENNAYFWQKIDTLFMSSTLKIIREKGDAHLQYANLIYPVRYGYLTDTANHDNDGVAVYIGSNPSHSVDSIIFAVDILKKDLEAKLLVGCSEEEESEILRFLNQTDFQKTILVRRGNELPAWGITD